MVHGETLHHWLRERDSLSLDQLVPFLERVAEVVQTAHDCGIVHRDLKPSNIMVIERAGQLLPKLLDFGIAKLLNGAYPDGSENAYGDDGESRPKIAHVDGEKYAEAEGDARAGSPSTPRSHSTLDCTPSGGGLYRGQDQRSNTSSPGAIGSPPYMAPEQWNGATVGSSSDLYALGVIAYEALIGRLRFTALTADRYSELHCLAPVPPLGDGFPPSLDRFFQRALAKHPEERWGSALELAAALRTELEARMRTQVRGRPADLLWRDTTLSELERWLRVGAPQLTGMETEFVDACRTLFVAQRQRTATVTRGLLVLAALLALGLVQYNRSMRRTRTAQQIAMAAAITAEVEQGRAALLHGDLAEARRHLTGAFELGDRSPSLVFMLSRVLQPRLAELGRLASGSGRMWSAVFSPDGKQIVATDDQGVRIWDAQTNQLLFTLAYGDTTYHAVYSTDGGFIVSAGGDGSVRVWSAADGTLMRTLRYEGKTPRYCLVALSNDGRLVAAIDLSGEIVHVWNVETGADPVELRNDGAGFPSIAFSADDRWLATSGGDDVRVFDIGSWAQAVTVVGRRIHALSFDPTGPRLLTGGAEGDATIWGIPSGSRLLHLRDVGEPIDAVAFGPSGDWVATASRDGTAQVWNGRSGKLQSQSNYLYEKILAIEFDTRSELVVVAGASGTVVVADASLGMTVATLDGPQALVRTAHFDKQSRRVVGASWDGTARVWDVSSPYRKWSAPPMGNVGNDVLVAPDQRFVATGTRDGVTRVWDTKHDRLLAELPPVTTVAGDFTSASPAVSPAGDRAAIARGSTVEIYELPSARLIRTVVHAAAVNTVAYAPNGYDLISGGVDGSLLVTSDGEEPRALSSSLGGIDAVTVLPDGRVLAADTRSKLRVHDRARRTVSAELDLPSRLRMLRPSQDGKLLVAIAQLTTAVQPTLWNLEQLRPIAQLEGHVGFVYSARFVRGDRQLLTAGGDGTARLWDAASGQLLQTYRARSRFLTEATLSPDGTIIVAGGADGLLRFWDAGSGYQLWTLLAHKTHIIGVQFVHDDIVTRGFAGEITRWSLPVPDEVLKACAARETCGIAPR